MNTKMTWIYIGIGLSFLYISNSIYNYHYGEFTKNEIRQIKNDLDIRNLPKIVYDEKTINKLYNSISLEKQYNNNN